MIWADRFGTSSLEYRFDVVGVLVLGRSVRVCHVPNAFQLS
jgi:hypothetical protein